MRAKDFIDSLQKSMRLLTKCGDLFVNSNLHKLPVLNPQEQAVGILFIRDIIWPAARCVFASGYTKKTRWEGV